MQILLIVFMVIASAFWLGGIRYWWQHTRKAPALARWVGLAIIAGTACALVVFTAIVILGALGIVSAPIR